MGVFWPVPKQEDTSFLGSLREMNAHWSMQDRIEALEQRMEELSLLSEALWQIVQDQHGVAEADLRAWAEALRAGRRRPADFLTSRPDAGAEFMTPLGDVYGPPPPPPVRTCGNCNTRFQEFDPRCPSCGCAVG